MLEWLKVKRLNCPGAEGAVEEGKLETETGNYGKLAVSENVELTWTV